MADVLEQVANGMAWEAIIEEWRGALPKEAIGEVVRLAREVEDCSFNSHHTRAKIQNQPPTSEEV